MATNEYTESKHLNISTKFNLSARHSDVVCLSLHIQAFNVNAPMIIHFFQENK